MLVQDTTTHYAVLGLEQDASNSQIKTAFRRIARDCHPDRLGSYSLGDFKLAENRFKRANYAFETLIDPKKRKEYDRNYNPNAFIDDRSFAYTGTTTRRVQLTYQLTSLDDRRMQSAWEQFISRPFAWSEKTVRFYRRWEFVAGIVTVGIVALSIAFGNVINGQSVFWFLFATESAPTTESGIPAIGIGIGFAAAIAITFLVAVHAVVTCRYSLKVNKKAFWRSLGEYAGNLWAMLMIVLGIAGLLIGHYLF